MASTRIKNLLGIARRGGFLVSGWNTITREVKRNKKGYVLVLVAADATSRSAEDLIALCLAHSCGVIRCHLTKDEMGLAIGQSHRGYVMIKDKGIARSIIALCEEMEESAHDEKENL